MKNSPLILFSFLLIIIQFSCVQRCDERARSTVAGMLIDFYSADGKHLYSQNPVPSLFNRDSLKISDDAGRSFILRFKNEQSLINPNALYYRVILGPIYYSLTDDNRFGQEITRQFYIKYSHTVSDTLICTFKNRDLKCANEFEYLRFFYKGFLIHEIRNDFSSDILKITRP